MPELVEIRLKGYVDGRHFDWCQGFTITHTGSGDTILLGPVVDQAMLHGILATIRDLALPLLSVNMLNRE
jgi:hypothetical protein